MAKKDIGYDFLNSKDAGFIRDNEDGESYRYSDGSGYYRDSDGSEGYIYSDGSGYYRGADGSEGNIYSDGSGYYRGADGSDGYRYADGTGYYNDSDGESSYFDGYSSEDDYGSTDSIGSAIGSFIGAGIASFIEKKFDIPSSDDDDDDDEDEYEDDDEDDDEDDYEYEDDKVSSVIGTVDNTSVESEREDYFYNKEKERLQRGNQIRRKRNSLKILTRKKTSIELSSTQCVGMDYRELIKHLEQKEFSNIRIDIHEDLGIDKKSAELKVDKISIDNKSVFDADTEFLYNAKIVISFHLLKRIKIPISSEKAFMKNADSIVEKLRNAGFTKVQKYEVKDLKIGLLIKDGSIKKIVINGKEEFNKRDLFRPDASIAVFFHTYKD